MNRMPERFALLPLALTLGVLAASARSEELASSVPPQATNAPAEASAPSPRNARFVWTGTTIGAKGERVGRAPVVAETAVARGNQRTVERANPRATADALLKELADVKLSIEVDRKLDEAEAKLAELAVRAAWKEDYAAKWDVLQEVALARSKLLEQRGKKDAALAVLERLLPDAGVKDALGARFEFAPADDALLAAEAKALAAPAIANAAARLRPGGSAAQKSGASSGDDQESKIEASVRAWLSTLDNQAILQLGTRAVPTLEKVVREAPNEMNPHVQCDALTLLFDLDEARGAEFVLAQYDAGGFLWKKRILRAMVSAQVLGNPGTWMMGADQFQRPVLVDTAWIPIVERLATDADVGGETLKGLVKFFALQDALTPKMQDALSHAVLEGSPQERQAAFYALDGCVNRPTVLRVVERALESKDASCRRFAAQFLVEETRSPALLARANDPDPEVRRIVLRSLTPRQVRVAAFTSLATVTYGGRQVSPELGTNERAALTALVSDPDAGVRAEAVRIAVRLSPPLPNDVYERIAGDEDVDLRIQLCELDWNHPAAPRVIEKLSTDSDASVLAAVDQWFAAQNAKYPLDDFEAAYLRRLEAATTITMDPNGNPALAWPLSFAMRRPSALSRILAIASKHSGRWLVPSIARCYPWPERDRSSALSPALAAATDDAFEAFVRVLPNECPTCLGAFSEGAHRAALAGFCSRAAWQRVLDDASLPRALRLRAASILGVEADARCEESLRKLLQEDSWRTTSLQDDEKDSLSDLGHTFRAERRADFLRGLIQDARTDDLALRWFVGNAPKDGLALAGLERWLDAPLGEGFVGLIPELLAKLPASDDPKTLAILRRALHHPRGDVATAYALGRMKTATGLELVAEALDAGWIADREQRAKVQIGAAISATAYMSETAAQKLLAGVTLAVTQEARKACLDGVEQIRTYLDEKKRWDLRDTELEQRASAVKELLPLLADPDATVRAQAAKSLATLDAAEHLPKLIALLKDKSPEVRAAAQLAIDQLNAKSAKKE